MPNQLLRSAVPVLSLFVVGLLAAACGATALPTSTPTSTATTSPTSPAPTSTVGATSTATPTEASAATSTPLAAGSAQEWVAGAMSATAITLGDGNVATSPAVGYVDSCTTSFRGGGAQHAGPWIDETAGTWDSVSKIAVQGSVSWPSATNSFGVDGGTRTITTNGLPTQSSTGTFPIASSDPAYQYDRNPNAIQSQSLTYRLPASPTIASAPTCVGLGPIGVMSDGVILFNALDDAGRDAAAHEVQDSCDGHPQMSGIYHYHDVASCLLAQATSTSTLVGYALDGFGIYVERDTNGNLPTNADLDECHGRTSSVIWDGQETVMYHYSATLEYPYTLGCFRGTPVR